MYLTNGPTNVTLPEPSTLAPEANVVSIWENFSQLAQRLEREKKSREEAETQVCQLQSDLGRAVTDVKEKSVAHDIQIKRLGDATKTLEVRLEKEREKNEQLTSKLLLEKERLRAITAVERAEEREPKYREAREQIAELKQRIDDMKDQYAQTLRDLQEAQQSIVQVETRSVEAERQLEKERTEKASATSDAARYKDELRSTIRRLACCRQQLEAATSRATKAEEEVKTKEERLDAVRVAASRADRLAEKLKRAEEEGERHAQSVDRALRAAGESRRNLENERAQREKALQQLSVERTQWAFLERSLEEKDRECERLREEGLTFQQQMKSLSHQIEILEGARRREERRKREGLEDGERTERETRTEEHRQAQGKAATSLATHRGGGDSGEREKDREKDKERDLLRKRCVQQQAKLTTLSKTVATLQRENGQLKLRLETDGELRARSVATVKKAELRFASLQEKHVKLQEAHARLQLECERWMGPRVKQQPGEGAKTAGGGVSAAVPFSSSGATMKSQHHPTHMGRKEIRHNSDSSSLGVTMMNTDGKGIFGSREKENAARGGIGTVRPMTAREGGIEERLQSVSPPSPSPPLSPSFEAALEAARERKRRERERERENDKEATAPRVVVSPAPTAGISLSSPVIPQTAGRQGLSSTPDGVSSGPGAHLKSEPARGEGTGTGAIERELLRSAAVATGAFLREREAWRSPPPWFPSASSRGEPGAVLPGDGNKSAAAIARQRGVEEVAGDGRESGGAFGLRAVRDFIEQEERRLLDPPGAEVVSEGRAITSPFRAIPPLGMPREERNRDGDERGVTEDYGRHISAPDPTASSPPEPLTIPLPQTRPSHSSHSAAPPQKMPSQGVTVPLSSQETNRGTTTLQESRAVISAPEAKTHQADAEADGVGDRKSPEQRQTMRTNRGAVTQREREGLRGGAATLRPGLDRPAPPPPPPGSARNRLTLTQRMHA
uniref:Uncharacterized protein n=1 Tax=Chromera velia CCMP2878 TaxID=1169474 RepID=A0A0G4GC02_9ALVE|eukprot:Cvel_21226.t1-p1 / transcript=Cvel_21226.t1 / gene=Cvel_21226 / organism=Chromera_velia_CCMP2878 / gene_product=Calponin homology domain-containing protein, putative / transcript_product=Calponin homology domain-containing protein, putative / location=Cvel_scaffold1973:7355-15885(+) / protein_length=963 / sequence_SO=supercontig / SO=protein_coding / is_pseudo=false